ncbi:MAG: NAD(P)/FAD-dependent oxidoreductase [Eubacterium sp.]|nr:NAD(P)/FAD-dependent oxidoreductase [Eubacterium sp.]
MSEKIIVAGGGHGGIAAAMLLSRAGFDVTVYEKSERKDMGYAWTDSFDAKALEAVGIPIPDEEHYEPGASITFVPPSERKIIAMPEGENTSIIMERKYLYDYLIGFAEEAGVKFEYGCEITAPLLSGDRVTGIRTTKGDFYAPLVIDACGCESVIRASLPDCCGIQKHAGRNESFYAYRALYNKACEEVEHKYKVYLIPNGRMGIGWVISDRDHSDLLIGEFEPFTVEEAEKRAEFFREHNPVLGRELLRGGIMTVIPVRHTLSVIVADGYAAIGDSAFMTVPLIGSGISNSLFAAAILADTVINDETKTYSAEILWDYQKRYFKEIGFGMAKFSVVRALLPSLTPDQIDYLFETEILTSDEMNISGGSLITVDPALIKKAVAIIKDKGLRSALLKAIGDMGRLTASAAAMPNYYSRVKVQQWAKKYDAVFASE